MTSTQSIKCELCGKETFVEETEIIEEGRGLLVCDKCAWEHNKAGRNNQH
jgi:ribosome-binding protein aMBF1 (putative translation factor)